MNLVSTSYVERTNLTMRMQRRRFTRLTNGFSKKAENHAHAVSLYFMYYNFCRPLGPVLRSRAGYRALKKRCSAKSTAVDTPGASRCIATSPP